ncbi:oxidoreductase [Tothia fuscella]|uniref:Oxidoreductase n=1 Tax=Tothia fuscella TaxID=1048955 RepID=A0A9P4P432_9PEZI|nr:oxidoreductase [Tothia fuscella]
MFDPVSDIPDLSGRVFLVTGGTSGIGKETVLALAAHNPAQIYFIGRNTASAEGILSKLKASFPSLTSKRLDAFIGNAGIMALASALTKDGYELQFGTNHVGHAALLRLLVPTMLRTGEKEPAGSVRILLLSSQGWALHPKGGILFDNLKTNCSDIGVPLGSNWTCYGQSKLANLLYATELARQYPTVTTVSIHPGVVNTNLVNGLGFWNRALIRVSQFGKGLLTPAHGAHNTLWAATVESSKIKSGTYVEPIGNSGAKLDEDAMSRELAKKLWDWTEAELKTLKA